MAEYEERRAASVAVMHSVAPPTDVRPDIRDGRGSGRGSGQAAAAYQARIRGPGRPGVN